MLLINQVQHVPKMLQPYNFPCHIVTCTVYKLAQGGGVPQQAGQLWAQRVASYWSLGGAGQLLVLQ